MKKHFLLSAAAVLFALGKFSAQTFVPVATTGYSLDGVAENTTAVSTTGGAMDASDFVLYSQYYGTLYSPSAVGLPNNGMIASGTRTYQLQNYSGFNVMHLLAATKDTLNFVTPQAFPAISLLCFGTQGSATASVTVRFTDNTTQSFTPFVMDDWFTIVSPVYSGFDRALRTSGAPALVGSAGNPRMFGADLNILCANQGKLIKRIIVQNNSVSAHLCIMAVSGAVPGYSVTGNPLICSGGTATLNAAGFSTYTWQPAGSFAGSNSGTITVSPTSNTTYTLTGTDISGCPGYTTVNINVSSGAPVLSLAGSSQSVCLGAAATITASGALAYTLSSPATNGGTFTPTATSVYTVTGANGCGSASLTTTITVSPLAITASAPTASVCAGSPATLSATGATNYTWMPGASTQTNYIASPAANTIYTVTGKTGNCIGTNTAAIFTKPVPTLSIAATGTAICAGDSVNLSVSGNALTYTWAPGNQTSTSIYVSPTSVSLYSVTGTNAGSCRSTAQQVVLVNPNPTVQASASNMVICKGTTVNLIASGATSYSWSTTDTGPVIVVNPSTSQIYTVTGSYSTGCGASSTVAVTVFSPSLAVSGNTAICLGSSANLSASGALSYTWVNTGAISPGINVSPAVSTIYTVTGSVSDPGSGLICGADATLQVSVNPLPNVTASVTRTLICRNETTELAGHGATTYSWNTGATTPSIVGTASIITTLIYTVYGFDALGCANTAMIQVKVEACNGAKTNTPAPGGLFVYPNPSSGVVHVTSEAALDIILVNELGQQLRHMSLNADNLYKASIEGLHPGIYFITCAGKECGTGYKLVITE